MSAKQRFTVYGNCQASALAAQLLCHPGFAARFEYVPLEPCFLVTEDAITQWVADHEATLDLLIAHNLNPGWRNTSAWDVQTVARSLRPEGRLLRYADIYFRGVNPALVYPKTFARPAHCDYLDLVSLTLAAHGFADAPLCAAIYEDEGLLQPDEVEAVMDLSEVELARRETGLEVQTARRIAELSLIRPAFHTFNHPSNASLEIVAQAIIDAAGIGLDHPQWLPQELLHTVHIPLAASLRAAYRRRGVEDAAMPHGTVRLERGELVDLPGYFGVALAALATQGPQALLQELALHQQDRVSGIVIRAIERCLCNRLALSPAVLAEVGRLNAAGISPDFLLTKADPQAVGFMVDLLGVVRQMLLPRLTGATFSVLDLGAKSGAGSELMGYLGQAASFSKVKFGVTCADIDPTFVDYCRARHPHVEYLNADVFKAGRQWDIVLCSHVVEHVPNPIDFVRRLRQVARQFVVLAFPYVEDPAKLIPGHIHSLGHDFLRALSPSRYEIYEGMFWSQSLCCIAVIDVRP